ncbi:MAG: SAM-dependent methyltransferase [Putridiphycobacter sp.]
MTGELFIIPIPISEADYTKVLPQYTIEKATGLRVFVVEKLKTARQFLRKIDKSFPIDASAFFELNKHEEYAFENQVIDLLKNGEHVGLMSESGYPGIADPGSKLVMKAHENNIKVNTLIGPSSIFLALAVSGLNGQGFTFNGYLPKKDGDRTQKLKQLNQLVKQTGFAQIFIETPYRNQVMFDDIVKNLSDIMHLTIALDITGKEEFLKTKTIKDWKKSNYKLPKTPCVFIIGQ